jgi:hypothetical protein
VNLKVNMYKSPVLVFIIISSLVSLTPCAHVGPVDNSCIVRPEVQKQFPDLTLPDNPVDGKFTFQFFNKKFKKKKNSIKVEPF